MRAVLPFVIVVLLGLESLSAEESAAALSGEEGQSTDRTSEEAVTEADLDRLQQRLDRVEASTLESLPTPPALEDSSIDSARSAAATESSVDRLEQRLERIERRLGETEDRAKADTTEASDNAAATEDNSWRYRWHRDKWWYWLPSERWVYWSDGKWVDYVPSAKPQSVQHRSYYAPSYRDYSTYGGYPAYAGGYYGRGYYGGGYYGGGVADTALGFGLAIGSHYALGHHHGGHHHHHHHGGGHHGGHFGGGHHHGH